MTKDDLFAMVDGEDERKTAVRGILKDNTMPIPSQRKVSFAPEVTLHKFSNVGYPQSKRRRTTLGYESGGTLHTIERDQNEVDANVSLQPQMLQDSSDEEDHPQALISTNIDKSIYDSDLEKEQTMELTGQIKLSLLLNDTSSNHPPNDDDDEQTMELTGQIKLSPKKIQQLRNSPNKSNRSIFPHDDKILELSGRLTLSPENNEVQSFTITKKVEPIQFNLPELQYPSSEQKSDNNDVTKNNDKDVYTSSVGQEPLILESITSKVLNDQDILNEKDGEGDQYSLNGKNDGSYQDALQKTENVNPEQTVDDREHDSPLFERPKSPEYVPTSTEDMNEEQTMDLTGQMNLPDISIPKLQEIVDPSDGIPYLPPPRKFSYLTDISEEDLQLSISNEEDSKPIEHKFVDLNNTAIPDLVSNSNSAKFDTNDDFLKKDHNTGMEDREDSETSNKIPEIDQDQGSDKELPTENHLDVEDMELTEVPRFSFTSQQSFSKTINEEVSKYGQISMEMTESSKTTINYTISSPKHDDIETMHVSTGNHVQDPILENLAGIENDAELTMDFTNIQPPQTSKDINDMEFTTPHPFKTSKEESISPINNYEVATNSLTPEPQANVEKAASDFPRVENNDEISMELTTIHTGLHNHNQAANPELVSQNVNPKPDVSTYEETVEFESSNDHNQHMTDVTMDFTMAKPYTTTAQITQQENLEPEKLNQSEEQKDDMTMDFTIVKSIINPKIQSVESETHEKSDGNSADEFSDAFDESGKESETQDIADVNKATRHPAEENPIIDNGGIQRLEPDHEELSENNDLPIIDTLDKIGSPDLTLGEIQLLNRLSESDTKVDDNLENKERLKSSSLSSKLIAPILPEPAYSHGSQPMELTQESRVDIIDTYPDTTGLNIEEVSTTMIPLAEASFTETVDGDYKQVTLNEFMQDIEVNFYDDFDTSGGYRASISNHSLNKTFAPIDYAKAVPKAELLGEYKFSCDDMKRTIEEAKKALAMFNQSILLNNPPLFNEYYSLDEDVRFAMNLKFQSLKDFSRSQSKRSWYEWRKVQTKALIEKLVHKRDNITHDSDNLRTKILSLVQDQSTSAKKLQTLKDELNIVRLGKQQLSRFNEEEVSRLEERLSTTREELNTLIKSKLKAGEHDNEYEILKSEVKSLRLNNKYNSEAVKSLELALKILRGYTNLEFVTLDELLNFIFDKIFLVKIDYKSTPGGLDISFHSKGDGQNQIKHKHLLTTIGLELFSVEKTGDVVADFIFFSKLWAGFKSFDKEVYKVSLSYPTSLSYHNNELQVSFVYYNQKLDYKLKIDCSLELKDILLFSSSIRVKTKILRGKLPSLSSILDDLEKSLLGSKIFSRNLFGELLTNLGIE